MKLYRFKVSYINHNEVKVRYFDILKRAKGFMCDNKDKQCVLYTNINGAFIKTLI